LVMMLTADKSHSITSSIQLRDARLSNKAKVDLNGTISFHGQLENKLQYYAVLKIKSIGGKVEVNDSSVQVQNADTLLLLMASGTNLKMSPTNDFLGKDPKPKVDSVLSASARFTYAQLKSRHIKDFSNLYGRVKLDLGPSPNLPSNQRLDAYSKGKLIRLWKPCCFNMVGIY